MPQPRRKPRTRAQKLANPAWRATLKDSELTPALRKKREENAYLKRDPLAPVTSNRDLRTQARDLAASMMMPEEQALAANERQAQADFATRRSLLTDLGNQRQAQMSDAFNRTNQSLNNLITIGAGVSGQDQAALASALRTPNQADQLAAGLGGVDMRDEDALIAQAAAHQAGLTNQQQMDAQARAGAAGQMMAIPGMETAASLGTLGKEFSAASKERSQARADLGTRKKSLVAETMKDLRDFEVAKRTYGDQRANMLFQQYLSERELGLKEKDMNFQQWLSGQQLEIQQQDSATNRRVAVAGVTGKDPKTGKPTLDYRKWLSDRNIDWANVGVARAQVEATMAGLAQQVADAKDKEQKEAAQARGNAWAKGLEVLGGYLAPREGEGPATRGDRYPYGPGTPDDPNTPNKDETTGPYKRTFDGAMRKLTQAGMSRSDALRMLMQSDYSDWRTRARQMYNRLKRRGGAEGYTKGPGKPD